jgi:hypothetical protein
LTILLTFLLLIRARHFDSFGYAIDSRQSSIRIEPMFFEKHLNMPLACCKPQKIIGAMPWSIVFYKSMVFSQPQVDSRHGRISPKNVLFLGWIPAVSNQISWPLRPTPLLVLRRVQTDHRKSFSMSNFVWENSGKIGSNLEL